MPEWVIREHFDGLAFELESPLLNSGRAVRAKAQLDALRISIGPACRIAQAVFSDSSSSPGEVAAAVVVLSCSGKTIAADELDELQLSREKWEGLRLGLRLVCPDAVCPNVTQWQHSQSELAQAVALDIRMFHRQPFEQRIERLVASQDDDVRRFVAGALGRSSDDRFFKHLALLMTDANPDVRRTALRAAARSDFPDLDAHCRGRASDSPPCLGSLRFLGVAGSAADHSILRRFAAAEATASAAIEAMGILGAAELLPDIVEAIRDPRTSRAAAGALERISGTSVPRGEPADPPDHLTADELDFWSAPGDPLPEPVEQWWNQNSYAFEAGKRYQAGVCVSDDPLGAQFDELPDEVRRDLYLRQRALDFENTPDWELETWPEYQRIPGAASSHAAI